MEISNLIIALHDPKASITSEDAQCLVFAKRCASLSGYTMNHEMDI